MPAIRAMCYPCLCLCFAFVQMTRTTPRRRTTLHLSQIRWTDALTFIVSLRRPRLRLRYSVRLRSVPLNLAADPAARHISRRQLDDHSVADQHANEIPFLAAAEMRRDAAAVHLDLI